MKSRNAVYFSAIVLLAVLTAPQTPAQISMSGGSYSQNFDSLGSAAANWTNSSTLLGWYSSKGNGDSTNYFADTGTSTSGGIHSYGVSGVSNVADRALGSIGASSITYTYGVRFITTLRQTRPTSPSHILASNGGAAPPRMFRRSPFPMPSVARQSPMHTPPLHGSTSAHLVLFPQISLLLPMP
jgi:hypothetical protein